MENGMTNSQLKYRKRGRCIYNMNVCFQNTSNEIVIVSLSNGDSWELQPKQIVVKELSCDSELIVNLSLNRASGVHKRTYTFVLETQYVIENVCENELITISREKVCFHPLPAYYDRLFLLPNNAKVLSESHIVSNAEYLKTQYHKQRRIDRFFIDPWRNNPFEAFGLLVIGIALSVFLGWVVALVYFPCAYFLLFAGTWLGERIGNAFIKSCKIFCTESEEFSQYFENEWINKYYSDPDRQPFMGKIEH